MLEKSEKLQKKSTPDAPKRKSMRQDRLDKPRLIILVTCISAVLAILITYFFSYKYFIQKKQHINLATLTQRHAKNVADELSRYLKSLDKSVKFYISKSSVERAFLDGEHAALFAMESDIKKNIANVDAVSFFPMGAATLNDDIDPPIRFSELQMIAMAEKRQRVPSEFSFIKRKWYYNVVATVPVDSSDKPLGTILIRFNVLGVNQILVASSAELGRVSLLQKIPNISEIEVTAFGQGDSTVSQRSLVPDSYFITSVQPSLILKRESRVDPLLFFIICATLACLFFIAAIIVSRKIAGHITAKDQAEKVRQVVAKKQASHSGDPDRPTDILDIQVTEEDEALLGLQDEPESTAGPSELKPSKIDEARDSVDEARLPSHIFRAYDIRGLAEKEITTAIAQQIGQAIGSEALFSGETAIAVARDARTHSPKLTEFLIRGILSTGCDVINVGTVPTPLLYFATHTLDATNSGVMVTASHNPAEYNGFKLIIDGKCRAEEDLKAIRSRILTDNLSEGSGSESRHDILTPYIDAIFSDVALAGEMSLVIDAANGVAGVAAPKLFEELGCQVTPLFCDLDGSFPNHDPDPSIAKNLSVLIERVKETRADLGLAFDGDGDRLVVVTPKGNIIWPDRLLMLFAKDIVSRNPGADVVFDVKSTRMLNACISQYGGRPIMWKTGHAHMKSKMQETGAILGGEYSGHIFIKDRWFGFDDGLYAAARLIEIMSLQGQTLDEIIEEFPETICTPEIKIAVDEHQKFTIVEKLIRSGDFGDAKITTLDGVRADFKKGWGLVRASNTSAALTLRFEADTQEDLKIIKGIFVRELKKLNKDININWEK